MDRETKTIIIAGACVFTLIMGMGYLFKKAFIADIAKKYGITTQEAQSRMDRFKKNRTSQHWQDLFPASELVCNRPQSA